MDILLGLISSNPLLATILEIFLGLALLTIPTLAAIRMITKATPSKADDDLADRIEKSEKYKIFMWFTEWLRGGKL